MLIPGNNIISNSTLIVGSNAKANFRYKLVVANILNHNFVDTTNMVFATIIIMYGSVVANLATDHYWLVATRSTTSLIENGGNKHMNSKSLLCYHYQYGLIIGSNGSN